LRHGIEKKVAQLDDTPRPSDRRRRVATEEKEYERLATDVPPAPAESDRAEVREDPAWTGRMSTTQTSISVNLAEFEKLLAKGMRTVIICGKSQAGKSEIAAGFTRARRIYRGHSRLMQLGGRDAGRRYDVALGGTPQFDIWYQLIDGRRVFFDPSGEFFDRFSYRRSNEVGGISENYFDFVRKASMTLTGVILVFDLTSMPDRNADSLWREQEEVSEFTLAALRWMRMKWVPRYEDLELRSRIGLHVERLPKLDVPVLVLFSKADQLSEESDYSRDHPLDFAREHLPDLHAALLTHTRRFRFDFAYTMVRKDGSDIPAKYPCGVLLPIEWVLHDPFRFRWLRLPSLPTRWLGGGK
jgi:GTP-binding protein EngB required for normal cell division